MGDTLAAEDDVRQEGNHTHPPKPLSTKRLPIPNCILTCGGESRSAGSTIAMCEFYSLQQMKLESPGKGGQGQRPKEVVPVQIVSASHCSEISVLVLNSPPGSVGWSLLIVQGEAHGENKKGASTDGEVEKGECWVCSIATQPRPPQLLLNSALSGTHRQDHQLNPWRPPPLRSTRLFPRLPFVAATSLKGTFRGRDVKFLLWEWLRDWHRDIPLDSEISSYARRLYWAIRPAMGERADPFLEYTFPGRFATFSNLEDL